MTPDPIIEEIRRARETTAARFGNDLRAICDDARRRQNTADRRTVTRPPRPARSVPAKVG